ncbi:MAG: (2Fe-2S)-binding protein [Tannerella sp.]|jgi:nitrite reductase/ring-hydroxylating ferredoxin subunit|nr:(2Fe-2S)-binding protein [Tannerella sp.]
MKKSLIVFVLLCLACHKIEDPIGNFPVYLRLDLTFEDKELRNIPSCKTYTAKDINSNIERVGFGGVLVVHAVDGFFYAFDLACPYEASRSALVVPDENSLNVVCPRCGTKYDISIGASGAPNGVSKYYLKRYAVMENGSQLIVSN